MKRVSLLFPALLLFAVSSTNLCADPFDTNYVKTDRNKAVKEINRLCRNNVQTFGPERVCRPRRDGLGLKCGILFKDFGIQKIAKMDCPPKMPTGKSNITGENKVLVSSCSKLADDCL